MRIPRVLGGGAAAALSVAWLVAGPGIGAAGASCVGPQLQVAPSLATPGQSVTVAGLYFGDDCNDTGRPGPVLGQPMTDIELSVRVGSRSKVVAVVDAGSDYAFSVEVVVPPSVGTGSGQVTVGPSGSYGSLAFAPLTIEGAPVRADDAPIVDATALPAEAAIPVEVDPSDGPPWWSIVLAVGAGIVLPVAAVATLVVVQRRKGERPLS